MRLSVRAFFLAALLGLLACAVPASPPPLARESRSPVADGSPRQAAPAGKKAPVRLAAWNVANFFDDVDHPGNDTVLTRAQYDKKVKEVAGVLAGLDADFVGLVEVENIDCLRALNAALDKPYPQFGLIEGNDRDRGIDVAFLSRLPVASVISHKDHDLPDAPGVSRNYKFSRDCLEVRLATSPPTTLFVNHFKSQLGSKKSSAAKRRVQAQAVVEIAETTARELPNGVEVVMGDLNDRPESWSLEPLMNAYTDIYADWPEAMRATHRSRRGASALDHILVSRDAVPRMEDPRVWQNAGRPTSDHDPVSVVLRLDKEPTPANGRTWTASDR